MGLRYGDESETDRPLLVIAARVSKIFGERGDNDENGEPRK